MTAVADSLGAGVITRSARRKGRERGWSVFAALAIVAPVILVAGCARQIAPAPVVQKGVEAPDRTASRRAGGRDKTGVIVAAGDNVYAIARRHGVAIRDLIEANSLKPPYGLSPGDRLRLPARRYHRVVAGETVYGISRRHGVDMKALVRANRIRPPYRIAAGRRLVVPAAGRPADGGVESEKLAKIGKPSRRSLRRALSAPAEKPDSAPKSAARASAPRTSGKRFLWPVRGPLITGFGPQKGGLHNDGINIAAPPGAPVLAADSGVVAYAGNGLRGFGNLLLVRHAGGWMTAYAHNGSLLVRRGETVRRGQTIARVGRSGNVRTPQLHFEIRQGRRAVNPRRLLSS